jgi:hypothetical protein
MKNTSRIKAGKRKGNPAFRTSSVFKATKALNPSKNFSLKRPPNPFQSKPDKLKNS